MTLKGRSKAAKARKLSESTGYRVNIIGIAWQGFESTYTYTFPYLPTQHQITLRAGDFQAVTDYQVTAVTRTEYADGYRVRYKVVDKWQKPDSQAKFDRAEYGDETLQEDNSSSAQVVKDGVR